MLETGILSCQGKMDDAQKSSVLWDLMRTSVSFPAFCWLWRSAFQQGSPVPTARPLCNVGELIVPAPGPKLQGFTPSTSDWTQPGIFLALLGLQQHRGHQKRPAWSPRGATCPEPALPRASRHGAAPRSPLGTASGVIHCRAIVLLWQALIYSPGNSFWFKVHIRPVNAP